MTPSQTIRQSDCCLKFQKHDIEKKKWKLNFKLKSSLQICFFASDVFYGFLWNLKEKEGNREDSQQTNEQTNKRRKKVIEKIANKQTNEQTKQKKEEGT